MVVWGLIVSTANVLLGGGIIDVAQSVFGPYLKFMWAHREIWIDPWGGARLKVGCVYPTIEGSSPLR